MIILKEHLALKMLCNVLYVSCTYSSVFFEVCVGFKHLKFPNEA
jgi:hypothetical protein